MGGGAAAAGAAGAPVGRDLQKGSIKGKVSNAGKGPINLVKPASW